MKPAVRETIELVVAVALTLGIVAVSFADDEPQTMPNITFGASTSFTYDANDPAGDPFANVLSYSNLEENEAFNIDLIQIGATGERGPISYGAKLNFGDLADDVGDSGGGDVGLQEAWLTWSGDPIAVTAGRF